MSLIEKVTDHIIYSLTTDLAEFLAESFGLDTVLVSDKIKEYLNCKKEAVSYNKTPPIITKKTLNIKPSISSANICKFVITRGKKVGKDCGTVIRGEGTFCSKHK